MKLSSLLFVIGILAVVLVAGCTPEDKEDGSCSAVSPDSKDACCAMNNVETPHVNCDGEWKFVGGENECTYECQPSSENFAAPVVNEDYCVVDDDCACGISVVTAECTVGNRDYIDAEDYREYDGDYLTSPGPVDEGEKEVLRNLVADGGICRQYCNGEIGQLEIKCVANRCVQR